MINPDQLDPLVEFGSFELDFSFMGSQVIGTKVPNTICIVFLFSVFSQQPNRTLEEIVKIVCSGRTYSFVFVSFMCTF